MQTLATGGRVDIAPAELLDLEKMIDKETEIIMAGRKVLLVEDNAINQQVASEILAYWKVDVDLANNGLEALMTIKEVGEDYYDAVLMDIQMPEMDGKEATRRIRGELNIKGLPIVAMTAHAMEEERRSCFEAGMDAHVSKPIEPPILLKTLIEQWHDRPRGKGATDPSQLEAPDAKAATDSSLPNKMPGLNLKDGLSRVMGNERLYRRLLDDFAENLPANADAIRVALLENKWEDAKKEAHALKGVAGNVGAQDLFDICQDIEKSLKMGKWQEAQDLQAAFDNHIDVAKESLTGLASLLQDTDKLLEEAQSQKSESSAVPVEKNTEALGALAKLLSDNDLGAMTLFAELIAVDPDLFGDSSKELEDCINGLEFEKAAVLLEGMDLE